MSYYDDFEDNPQTPTEVIRAGTIVYHGTSSDFDETQGLSAPFWVSRSEAVARWFATRHESGEGSPRVASYRLTDDIELPLVTSPSELDELLERHGLEFTGVDDIIDGAPSSRLDGWIIPNNYPDGDDILVVHSCGLDYVETINVTPSSSATARR